MTDESSRGGFRLGRRHPAVRFIIYFVVCLFVLSVLFSVASAVFHPQMVSFMALTAYVGGGILDLAGMDVHFYDRYVTVPRMSIEVIEECTGLYEIVIFIAAVLAYPAVRREKLIGVAGGTILLYALNTARMVFLIAVANTRPDWFDFLHIYFWQATLILMITSVWLLWITKVVKHGSPGAAFRA